MKSRKRENRTSGSVRGGVWSNKAYAYLGTKRETWTRTKGEPKRDYSSFYSTSINNFSSQFVAFKSSLLSKYFLLAINFELFRSKLALMGSRGDLAAFFTKAPWSPKAKVARCVVPGGNQGALELQVENELHRAGVVRLFYDF